LRTLSGVAASLILVALVAMALLQDRNAQASPDMMLQLHRDIVSGKVPSMPVDSVEEVNQAFLAFGNTGMQLSGPSDMKPMACCMKDVGNKKVMCVSLSQEMVPVTLTVADLDAVKPLTTPAVSHDGYTFHVQSDGKYTMVTMDLKAYRVCMIGELGAEKLMTLAEGLKLESGASAPAAVPVK